MESICSDILEQVQLMDTRLMVIAISVQLSSDKKVKAIQIRKDDCNIVFNVSLGSFLKKSGSVLTTISRQPDSHRERIFQQRYEQF
jgi:hypothetical protein